MIHPKTYMVDTLNLIQWMNPDLTSRLGVYNVNTGLLSSFFCLLL